ncbi:MAG: hypothetical protein L0H96_02090 [Humibacillus sp.]|nr:hypothetical protein [Humibacillus sp.]MDN5775683.1 hypothetical protein [Humibacillus sp.]
MPPRRNLVGLIGPVGAEVGVAGDGFAEQPHTQLREEQAHGLALRIGLGATHQRVVVLPARGHERLEHLKLRAGRLDAFGLVVPLDVAAQGALAAVGARALL